ncbi:unnamed protein product [Phytophthora lilii]|uniref:Unnamed protein product n=1 Tax=Phytophthora lilii TaxID=2077276 RepID=A0A9W6WUH2_9STRA|nr:unnamed protein product [Phytophthora lilii]
MLASNLVHAIEDSKHTVNISAYHAEKAARVRRQSATYTDMIVAAITAKPKQSLLSPSASRRSSTASCRRAPQAGIGASELARSRAMIKSAPSAEKSGPEHDSSQPVGQQRQSFALAVDPPKLSANYRLLFGQTLKKNEIQPLQLHQSSNSEVIEAGAQQERRDRPSSSLTKKSLPLELTSRSLATAIYSGGSIFVEPSPLSKRLPHRGSLSAGGVRRKLTVLKRVQRAQTEYLPSTKLASLDFVDHSTIVDKPKRSPQPVEPEAQEADATLSFRKNDEDENDASTGVITAEKEEQDEREDDEEAYEDDFDTTGDDEDTDKKMPTRDTTASDGELIDMLHDISAEDHSTSSPVTTLKLTEVKAATTIQRHVRGRLVRQAFTRPSSSSKTPVRPPEYKGPRRITSKREINGSNREARKGGKMTLSARAHRQVHSQGRDKFSRKQTIPRGASKAATSSACPANTVKMSSVGGQRQSSETNNQLSSPSKSPQLGEFSALKNATTSMNEVEPEQRAEEVKGPPDPEALKQIQALYAEGLQHHKENHLGLAIECYEKALVIPGGQDFASLHVNLGSALMAQNKFSEALEFFEQAKRIQPNNVKAMYNNSLALLHLNRPREAQQLVRLSLSLKKTGIRFVRSNVTHCIA